MQTHRHRSYVDRGSGGLDQQGVAGNENCAGPTSAGWRAFSLLSDGGEAQRAGWLGRNDEAIGLGPRKARQASCRRRSDFKAREHDDNPVIVGLGRSPWIRVFRRAVVFVIVIGHRSDRTRRLRQITPQHAVQMSPMVVVTMQKQHAR